MLQPDCGPAPFERIYVPASEQAAQLPRLAGDEATRIALNHHMRSSVYAKSGLSAACAKAGRGPYANGLHPYWPPYWRLRVSESLRSCG